MSGSNPPSNSSWATYTHAQLHQVYDRIKLPNKYRYEPGQFSREVVRHRDGMGFLSALQRHMLASVPFENLDMHYSQQHHISINAEHLFNKIVRSGSGRGGYCIENGVFLGTVLRSLGFEVTSVGARINLQSHPTIDEDSPTLPSFGGWSHVVHLVTLRGEIYVVDVGFGAGGPTRPLLLEEGTPTLNLRPNETVRLRRDYAHPEPPSTVSQTRHLNEEHKVWFLERCLAGNDNEQLNTPWVCVYCFSDKLSFLPQDFEVMSWFASTHRTSFFTYRVIASRYLLDWAAEELMGHVLLYEDRVLRMENGEEVLVEELRSERQRVEALQKWIGISLSTAQIEGIKGTVTEIQGN